jgi:hypothetical protein
LLPPTQPSPTGEGVEITFSPLGETGKGVSSENYYTILTILSDKRFKVIPGFCAFEGIYLMI